MAFSKKRGRPRAVKLKNDRGTKELQQKRKLNITTEPLDLCYKKGLITSEEHNAGMRFRWLYRIKHGSPDLSSYDYMQTQYSQFWHSDEEWLQARQVEYQKAIEELKKVHAKRIIMNICIFNQYPTFLTPHKNNTTNHKIISRQLQYRRFKDGIAALADIR